MRPFIIIFSLFQFLCKDCTIGREIRIQYKHKISIVSKVEKNRRIQTKYGHLNNLHWKKNGVISSKKFSHWRNKNSTRDSEYRDGEHLSQIDSILRVNF